MNQSTPEPKGRLAGALSALKERGSAHPRHAFERPLANPLRIGAMNLTQEQGAALASGARKIKVQAFAGAGKTTLLRAFAEQAHQASGFYLAFNQSIAREAQAGFPANVRCQTHNATALRALGSRDAAWRSLRHGKLDQITKGHLQTIPGGSGLSLDLVLATLFAFIQSADGEISEKHFPLGEALFLGNGSLDLDPGRCLDFASVAWGRMSDPTSEIPMPHDGYLKLWSINPSQLPCDFVLIDESQDSNPAFLAGMAKQRCRQIYVGDEHQGIYGFRGAVNALATLDDCETHNLTLTHRFGEGLSLLANAIVSHKGGSVFLRSSPSAARTQIALGRAPLGQAPLYLARTNAGLFEQALSLAQQGKNFGLVGGGAKFQFPDLSDLLALAQGSASGRYAAYANIDALEEEATEQGKNDLALRAKLAKTHGAELPRMLEAINKRIQQPGDEPASPGPLPKLSTVHQAKGLESDWVELLGDFIFTPERSGKAPQEMSPEHIEECNVLYVALTRARQGLALQAPALAAWAKELRPDIEAASCASEKEDDLFGS